MPAKGSAEAPAEPDLALVYLKQSAIRLAQLCRKHFAISGDADHLVVAQPPSPNDILEFLRAYSASIRPVGLSPAKAIPSASAQLRTFLWAAPLADLVLNDVVRLSLYCDQVVIVDPFSKHVAGRSFQPGEKGPFNEPAMWVQSFVNWGLMVCALEPWVAAGLVVLIPEPQNFIDDAPAFEAVAARALRETSLFVGAEADALQDMLESAAITCRERSELAAVVALAVGQDGTELNDLVDALTVFAEGNPTRYLPSNPEHSSLIGGGSGQNIFEAGWIADRVGGYLVPHGNLHRRLFRRVSRGEPARDANDGLAAAFTAAKLPMLHNVSLETALDLRRTGRLTAFRRFLFDVWAATAAGEAEPKSTERERDLVDRLTLEYARAKDDWSAIYRDLGIKAITTLAAAPLAQVVEAGIVPAAAGAMWWTYSGWSRAARSWHGNPAALLVQLEHSSSPNPVQRALNRLERHL